MGGGLISIRTGTNKPESSKLGMNVNGISANGENLVTWGDKKPTGYISANLPFIELSKNSGESWNTLNIYENIVDAWFNSTNELYVATESEVMRINNTEDKVESILTLETQFEGLDYSDHNIAILSNKKIYTTNDYGENWNEFSEPEPILSHQISKSGQVIVFTQDRKVLLKNEKEWDPINLPTTEIAPTDIKAINNDLFLIIGSELWVYDLNYDKWSKLESNRQFRQLIKKGHNLFGISEEGIIYTIDKGGDSIDYIANRLFLIGDKIVSDVEYTQKGLFIATQPDFIWEDLLKNTK